MASKHPHQDEALFAVSEQTGQIVEHDFYSEDQLAVPLDERSIHLQNAITYLAHMSMLNGFLSFGDLAERTYGDRATAVRQNASDRIEQLSRSAKREFAQATGHYSMIEAGEPVVDVKRSTRRDFSDFLKNYYGPRHYKKAQAYRRQLADDLELMRGQDVSEAGADQNQSRVYRKPEHGLTKLDNHEKLSALLDDPSAGFLPATNREKTKALTLLDYVNRPDGTADQHMEIFTHVQRFEYKNSGMREGLRAVESNIYEMGDYAADAFHSHEKLSELQMLVSEVLNPKLTLEVAIGPEHPGFAVLKRFTDLRELYRAKYAKVMYYTKDPMCTTEDRTSRVGEGKHKTIHDRYTEPHPQPHIIEAIQEFAATTQIGDVRQLIADALSNEERRAVFFMERLHEMRALSAVSRVFDLVVDVANNVIDENEAA